MVRSKTKRMTVRVIESLPGPPPEAKTSNIEYSVSQESNLVLAVYKNGSRSWRFKIKFRGKRLFLSLGKYPLMDLSEAIDKTRQYKKMISEDIDPRVGGKSEAKMTFADFIKSEFLPHARKHYKTFGNQENMLNKRILNAFGEDALSEITKRQIVLFHKQVCEEVSGTTGNRHLSLLSASFKYGVEVGLIDENPCRGIRKARENKSRDRFLQEDEYVRFIQCLSQMLDNPSAQAIFLLIALGLRRSEVLGLAWKDVSLTDRHLYLRDPKNGESRYAVLNTVSVELLTKMHGERDPKSPWVFPSKSASGHLEDIRRVFAKICDSADIKGLRLHDLRRSHASHLLNSGVDIGIIKEHLGHKSLKSTQIYARVATSSLVKSSEIASDKIQEVLGRTS